MKVYLRGHHKGQGFIGKFIGWFTFGRFRHASGCFVKGNIVLGFQSNMKKGCHFFDWEDLPDTELFEVPCTNEQAEAMLERAREIDGCGYDSMGIWGFVRRAKREDPNKFFCSEAWADIVAHGGIWLQNMAFWSQSPVILLASPLLVAREKIMLDTE